MLPDGRQRAFRWFSRMKEDRHYHISHSSTPLVRRTVSARIDILTEFSLIRLFGVRKQAAALQNTRIPLLDPASPSILAVIR
jgi:hypothetical protein